MVSLSLLDQSLELESCPEGEDCASRELFHYAHYDHTELGRQRLARSVTSQSSHNLSPLSRKLKTLVERTNLTSQSVTQGNFLSHIPGISLRHSNFQGRNQL